MNWLFLFDIDGTILKLNQYRSKQIFKTAFKDLFAVDVSIEKMPDFSGMTDLQILYDICESADFSYDLILERKEELWEYLMVHFREEIIPENVTLMPYITEFIDYLKSIPNAHLGIVTGNFRQNAILKLDTYSLADNFEIGAYGCEHRLRDNLPPLALKRAAKAWDKDFKNQNTIIIGDSPKDIIAAKANEMKSLAIATGFCGMDVLAKYSPDILIADLENYKVLVHQIIEN